jgi:hypothetical protein
MLKAYEIYWYCFENRIRLKKYEYILAKDPYYSYDYALNILKGRFVIGENILAKDGNRSYLYARYILNDRFILAEKYIKQSTYKKAYEQYFNIKL